MAEKIIIVHSNYSEINSVLAENGIKAVQAIVADLGLSSDQLNDFQRGFSFQSEYLLDMRMDQSEEYSAMNLVNDMEEEVLAKMLFVYGDEKKSRRIAQKIVQNRPIENTQELANLIEKISPRRRGQKIHPATKTFQAIRIAVNREFEHLKKFLKDGIKLLKVDGRMAVVSFHSGEDKIVKNIFRTNARGCICPEYVFECNCGHQPLVKLITRKPLKPTELEVQNNPRARSARLRVIEKIKVD
jgi:16S rRNA (cytosine1402-N4)-methyltransferase